LTLIGDGRQLELFPRTGPGWILKLKHDDPVVASDIRRCARHDVLACLKRTGNDHSRP
jgi:hypothetical protein